MTTLSRISLAGFGPVHERAREDGAASAADLRRRADGIREANALSAEDAIALARTIRARALRQPLPDSTPMIRAERDTR